MRADALFVAAYAAAHSEVPRLYTGMALVAATAATLLTAAQLTRRHHVAEVIVLGAVMLVGLGVLRPLTAQPRGRQ